MANMKFIQFADQVSRLRMLLQDRDDVDEITVQLRCADGDNAVDRIDLDDTTWDNLVVAIVAE